MDSYNERNESYTHYYFMAIFIAIVVGLFLSLFFSLFRILLKFAWEHKIGIGIFIGLVLILKYIFGKKKQQRREYENPYR